LALWKKAMLKKVYIPWLLVGLRVAIAPMLLLDALDRQTSPWFLMGYILAILSDIFDGILARRWQVSTPRLRQADSWADIWLFICLALCTWLVYPQVIMAFQLPLIIALAAQFTLFTISLIKFHKFPSFHTYTAKAWGLMLLVATIALFGFGYINTLWLAIAACLLNTLEEIIMTLILPKWQCDILSVFHALKLRQTLLLAAKN
jgi:phosphatidylglycerophosphate synthase